MEKLELILEAAYRVFYSDSTFDLHSHEARRLEARTLAAERFILQSLRYDVFWPGLDYGLLWFGGVQKTEITCACFVPNTTFMFYGRASTPYYLFRWKCEYSLICI